MNNILQLKGLFEQKSRQPLPIIPSLPKGGKVEVGHLKKLKDNLLKLKKFWFNEELIPGALIGVCYKDVIAKSRRISGTFSKGKKITSNSSIVGACFTSSGKIKHIITHYVSIELLNYTISNYENVIEILEKYFEGVMTSETLKEYTSNKKEFLFKDKIGKDSFFKIIIDAYYVEDFILNNKVEKFENDAIVSLYETDIETLDLLKKIGINIFSNKLIDKTTILLTPEEIEILYKKAPYLVAMAVTDINEYDKFNYDNIEYKKSITPMIPSPKNEPTIGVIDTLFDEKVYFSEWVEYHDMIAKEIKKDKIDYEHGTSVTSIIVDGPTLNPDLDDGCGRFKVRHFGVALHSKTSSFVILKQIEEIIKSNRDIKVWNLSLGSKFQINDNFVSPEAAIIDKIQYENDVIFIIAGTNKVESEIEKIGAPADSINSLVVNSINSKKEKASYSRKGPVLSFFTKPDISYYGGDIEKKIKVYTGNKEKLVMGTSYAAPWIARKMAYLINILGLSREVAKALIINSATTWEENKIENSFFIGHGIVPIKIEDILKTKNDEITFILTGTSERYDTYTYNLPIPVVKDKHPFIAKATLCYFPACKRNQGVDYTTTELDISFGRIKENSIETINNNFQTLEGNHTYEGNARIFFRKWDNVKHIREVYKKGTRSKKAYDKGLWGISLKTKERLDEKHGRGIKFGIVVTLKEIDGVNRIEEFIRNCFLRGWLVNKLDVVNQVEIYNKAEEIISFDD